MTFTIDTGDSIYSGPLPVNYSIISQPERRAVRLRYIKDQGGKCHHCAADLSGPPSSDVARKKVNRRLFPASFFKSATHLHHNHKTGVTIGAVHCHCNAVLWQYHGE